MPEEAVLEAATDDTPAGMTPLGDVFAQEMARLTAAENGEAAPITEGEKPAAKPPAAEKPKDKPKSALDAALSEVPADAETVEDADEDPLKDLPEELPKDGKGNHWKSARAQIERLNTELKASKSAKVDADPAITGKVTELEKRLQEREEALSERQRQLDELSDVIVAVNVERHPDFRREFIDGRKSLVEAASAKLKSYGGNPEALAEALAMPEGLRRDEAVEEVIAELKEGGRSKILRYISEVEALDERREKALAEPQQAFEAIERKTIADRSKADQQAEELKTSEYARIAAQVHKTVPFLKFVDETMEGGKEWNAAVLQARENGFKLFGKDATFESQTTALIKGMDYDRVAGIAIAKDKALKQALAQLAEYDGASPDVRGGKGPAKSKEEANLEKTPEQIYMEVMARGSEEED